MPENEYSELTNGLKEVKQSIDRLEKAITGDEAFGHKGLSGRMAQIESLVYQHDRVLEHFPEKDFKDLQSEVHQIKNRLWWIAGILTAIMTFFTAARDKIFGA